LRADVIGHYLTFRTGGRQSGVYCGVKFVLDKMRSGQQIDAFLAARYVTRRRPQFFQTQARYNIDIVYITSLISQYCVS
jgi:hypothetical protein